MSTLESIAHRMAAASLRGFSITRSSRTAPSAELQSVSTEKVSVSPGIGFGQYGDTHVRFALIENEARSRQAVRGIKEMFKKDGLL